MQLSSRPPLGEGHHHQRSLHGPLALGRPPVAVVRAGRSRRALRSVAEDRNSYNARKGKQWENSKRRRGRPAHMRSPYDSPLRDGNRDRLIGLLTERAAKTLMVYLMETNANVYSWLIEFYKANPIPRHGSWDEVSGESFLRKLLSMPIEEAKFNTGRDSLFDNVTSCGVDPRSIAQRIMDIRTQLSEEFVQELQAIAEENSLLLRESLTTSLSIDSSSEDAAAAAAAEAAASGTQLHPEVANPPPPAPAASSGDGSGSDAAGKPGSSSSGKAKGSKAPPPSPVSGSSKASSNSSSSGKVDNAAAVAALNAALMASSAAGSGAARTKDDASSSSGDKVSMPDVLAQLRRAMDAEVAREVTKMTGVPPPAPPAAAEPATPPTSDSDSTAVAAAATGDDAAAAAGEAGAQGEEEQPQQQQPAVAASEADAAGAAAGVDVGEDSGADTAPSAADEGAASVTAAAAAVTDSAGGDASDADEGAASGSPSASAQSLVGVSGTYSRTLPKGWGPRLGVGFSRFPRVPSHNNIVSSAGLAAPKAADQQEAGSEGVEV